MKAKELAEKLMETPEFEVGITVLYSKDNDPFYEYLHYYDVDVANRSYSERVVILSGESK